MTMSEESTIMMVLTVLHGLTIGGSLSSFKVMREEAIMGLWGRIFLPVCIWKCKCFFFSLWGWSTAVSQAGTFARVKPAHARNSYVETIQPCSQRILDCDHTWTSTGFIFGRKQPGHVSNCQHQHHYSCCKKERLFAWCRVGFTPAFSTSSLSSLLTIVIG